MCFRKDRELSDYPAGTYTNPARGGTAIIVKGSLNPRRYEEGDIDAEIVWVKIHPLENVHWLVGCCYRPEVAEDFMLTKICNSINSVDTENVVLTGDFNFRNINWNNLSSTRDVESRFIDCILDNSLTQIVDEPTRKKNTLDLIFIGDVSTVQTIKVKSKFGGSDHNAVYTEIQCPVPRITYAKRKIYLYSKGDYDGLNEELESIEWNSVLNSKSIDINWGRFKRHYNDHVDKYVPSKMIQIGQRHKPPWSRYKSISKAKDKCRKAKIRAKSTGLMADEILHEEAQKEVNASVVRAKGHYEDKLVENLNSNPERFWNYAF